MPVPTPLPAAQPKLSSSRRWIPVILGAMLLSGVALFLLPDPGPRHQGKSLRHWLTLLTRGNPAEMEAARAAIQAMGSNSLPYLEPLLTRTDGAVRTTFLRLLATIDWPTDRFVSDHEWRHRASLALAELGPHARPLLPQLLLLARTSDDSSALHAARVLAHIRPDGIVALTNALLQGDIHRPGIVVYGLAMACADPNPPLETLPAMLAVLQHSNAVERTTALSGLALFQLAPDQVIPAIIPCLNDPHPQVRLDAANVLRKFGPAASNALPALERLCNDPAVRVRGDAQRAIDAIRPTRATAP